MNQSSTKITSDNTQDINDSEKNNSVNVIKEVATIKENSKSVESNNQSEKSKNQVIGDSMLNGIHERYEQG